MITEQINDDQITGALNRLLAALGDLTPVMQDAGEFLIKTTKERFPKGVSPEGVPWAPKSSATIDAYRTREGKGGNGRMDFRPLFGPSGSLSSTIAYRAGPDFVEWGSPMVYAGTMQYGVAKGAFGATRRGAPIPWGNIPARPFLGLSHDDRAGLVALIEEWLEAAAGKG